ncbi:hypothetical protein ABL78_2834 [Leptomonas seymouri]|uniref:Uncharacterized protein n=1 Tax=Leptomonas seymouri TaxID=5684 RepID=A0A0N1I8Q0_LEPSE|nr:hypothetical protein ABL78_2834 [Leptomonas seymouri]|eukprot:KPI88058.1 hypothetical protein ABL78_2834 [Leptomonas seymouri]
MLSESISFFASFERTSAQRARLRAFIGPPSRQHQTTVYPQALPALDYYERFPQRVGPVGNVVMTSEAELGPWLLIARRVPLKEAERRGGCIIYSPAVSRGAGARRHVDPLCLCITDSDDAVYGRAVYRKRPPTAGDFFVDEDETFSSELEHSLCGISEEEKSDATCSDLPVRPSFRCNDARGEGAGGATADTSNTG